MMELLISIFVFGLAAAGLGLGLTFGRGPVRTSCGAAAGLKNDRCLDCPLRRNTAAERAEQ
ncbi:hypothetical protein SAMN04488002_0224 [Litoreibacter janthinus]|uniref:(Na+)-NQR maturation NqrM n=1 Tax=Litoreibacter janthinus TaxID=670154 RepID=A0A1I6FSG8_9RHOB|nr:hypothetical protein SAMN04488002_0224 [Litoreibacter janthinus]